MISCILQAVNTRGKFATFKQLHIKITWKSLTAEMKISKTKDGEQSTRKGLTAHHPLNKYITCGSGRTR